MSRFSVIRVSACAFALAVATVGCGDSSSPLAPSTANVITPANPSPAPGPSGVGVQGLGGTTLPAGNPTCQDLAATHGAAGATWFEVKLDRSPNATESFGDGVLNVSITNGTKKGFDWSANRAVDAVLVKSGSLGNSLYVYSPEASSGTGLTTPGALQDISHISVCYDVELEVSTTAATTFSRDYDWSIAKTVDQAIVTMKAGGQVTVNYSVAVTKDAGTDSDWSVSGTIKVTNPHPTITASGVAVTENLSAHGAMIVSCPATSLAPLANMTCAYGATAVASGSSRTGTAAATSGTYGIARGEGTAAVAFATPTKVFDTAVDVNDTFSGALGAGLAASKTYAYPRTIQATSLSCGTNTVGNTASIATDDGLLRTSNVNVTANLDCSTATPPPPPPAPVPPAPPAPVIGCAYSQGYWSSHSSRGPAPYNDTWAKIGENTPFYKSGISYYDEINISPKGNAYHILASQFIAAKLNMLAGAAAPAGINMGAIETFYSTYTPSQIDLLKGNDPVRKQALDWSGTLDSYNNGKLNVSHCS